VNDNSKRVEVETDKGKLVFWIETCDECHAFVGLPFDTTGSTIVVQSIKMPEAGTTLGLYFCQYCEATYLESLHDERERLQQLLATPGDFSRDLAELIRNCWQYVCLNFLDCRGPDNFLGCLHCGKLTEIDLDASEASIFCECGQRLSQFLDDDDEEAKTNTRFLCRACAGKFAESWRTSLATIEAGPAR
jgi:hypothetical protein